MAGLTFVYVAERASEILSVGVAKDLQMEAFVEADNDPLASFLYIEEATSRMDAINRQVQLEAMSDMELREFIMQTNPSLKNLLTGFHARGLEPPPGGEGAGDRSPLKPVRPRAGANAEQLPATRECD